MCVCVCVCVCVTYCMLLRNRMCLSVTMIVLIDLKDKAWKLVEEGQFGEAIRMNEKAREMAEQHLEVTDGLRLSGEECCFD